MADEFFGRFAEHMTAEQQAEIPASSSAETAMVAEPGPAAAPSAPERRLIWPIAITAILAILLAWALYR
jgi:hypothetical protein